MHLRYSHLTKKESLLFHSSKAAVFRWLYQYPGKPYSPCLSINNCFWVCSVRSATIFSSVSDSLSYKMYPAPQKDRAIEPFHRLLNNPDDKFQGYRHLTGEIAIHFQGLNRTIPNPLHCLIS